MGYRVVIQRDPEIIHYDTFEEAEAKMKELFQKYGERPTKYCMVKEDMLIYPTRYDCDKDGNVRILCRY